MFKFYPKSLKLNEKYFKTEVGTAYINLLGAENEEEILFRIAQVCPGGISNLISHPNMAGIDEILSDWFLQNIGQNTNHSNNMIYIVLDHFEEVTNLGTLFALKFVDMFNSAKNAAVRDFMLDHSIENLRHAIQSVNVMCLIDETRVIE